MNGTRQNSFLLYPYWGKKRKTCTGWNRAGWEYPLFALINIFLLLLVHISSIFVYLLWPYCQKLNKTYQTFNLFFYWRKERQVELQSLVGDSWAKWCNVEALINNISRWSCNFHHMGPFNIDSCHVWICLVFNISRGDKSIMRVVKG